MILKSCLDNCLPWYHTEMLKAVLGFLLILLQQVILKEKKREEDREGEPTTNKQRTKPNKQNPAAQLHNCDYHHMYFIDSLRIFNIACTYFEISST